ncbi:MAG: peptide-methionine (S)-S-oxide reductase MsrA [Verrucomicrobiales bacterium]
MTSIWKWLICFGFIAASLWFLTQALPQGDRRHRSVDLSHLRAADAAQAAGQAPANLEIATLAAGCFWCVEAVLERIAGVHRVESGYTGGESPDPTYRKISSGRTGHAECVQIEFDPTVLSYEQLLTVFWELHDPTTRDRQGADRGSQYRSVIFYHDDEQRRTAERSLAEKEASGDLRDAIVTALVPATKFYPAEETHQDYFSANPDAGYCRMVISPKLKKLGLLE